MAVEKIEINKITLIILTFSLSFLSWFGKVTYDKLISIDTKVETVLVENAVYKSEIEEIKSEIKELHGNCLKAVNIKESRNPSSETKYLSFTHEAVLPKKQYLE